MKPRLPFFTRRHEGTKKGIFRSFVASCLRVSSLLLVFAALVATAKAEPLKVLTSFYPMYVMTLNVVGNTPGVTVACMTEPFTGCLHDYQLAPADLKKLAMADVFVANGAGMETFLEKAVSQSPTLRVIEASKGIPLAFPGNPHLWVSITGAIAETNAIAKGLEAADPVHAAAYANNAADYVARLEALRQKMHAALDGMKGREIVTFHEAFPYFASEFGLKIVSVVEREPGSEPSAGELAATIRVVREHKIHALFAEPQYPARSAQMIERETGVPVRVLDPAVTGPMDPAQARGAYLRAMEANLKVLREALRE